MAKAASRSSANTALYVGTLKADVGLFGTQAKPATAEQFVTAGPNGGALRYEERAQAAPVPEGVEQPRGVKDSPLGEPTPEEQAYAALDPVRAKKYIEAQQAAASAELAMLGPSEPAAASVPGEFRRVMVEEGTGAEVEPEDVRRGIRLEDGRFVDCTDQLHAITERTKLERIDVVACIDSTQVRRERVIGSYFVGSQDARSSQVLRLLYESLRARREVAVVKYTTRSRQQLGVIAPNVRTGALVLLSCVFAEDFRDPPAKATAIQSAEVSSGQVEAMGMLLGALHGTVDDMDALRDDALALREELRARAEAGEMDAGVVEPLPAAQDVSLEDALAASLATVGKG